MERKVLNIVYSIKVFVLILSGCAVFIVINFVQLNTKSSFVLELDNCIK